MKRIFTILGLLLASLTLIACGDNVEEKPEVEYTITFNVDGGIAVGSQMRTAGQTLGNLPTPTKDDHEFKGWFLDADKTTRSEEHTSELQSRPHLVCRLLLEKKKKKKKKQQNK